MEVLSQAAKNRTDMARIKQLYATGTITRPQAKAMAQPILDRINKSTATKTAELNRKYDLRRKPALLSFVSAMRNEY
ncbi:MAG TPA: hypothetical protein VK674_03615 [Candidatus Limnocylindria bacterium]|nr:hypothetical protein [Candidatus Limnocylindria bacterium]